MNILRSFLLAITLTLSISSLLQAQELSIYNPQTLYDDPDGLYDTEIIRTMFIDFENSGYHNTLVDAFFENPALRIPASVSIEGFSVDSVGVRYKGNSTFCLPNGMDSPKLPYNLDFNFWDEENELMGYKKIKLANAWLDPTFVKEYMAALIYRRYLPSPEVSLVALNTQGNYTGLYVNTESINKQFLKKHFDDNDGAFFKCDPAGVFCIDTGEQFSPPNLNWLGEDSASYYNSYDLKSEYGWSELQDLIYTINFDGDNIDEVLNVDRTLWALAVNQVISNLDTYNGYYVHNYYLYLSDNGLWQMIPWDFDNAFIGAIMGWDYYAPEGLYEYDIYEGAAEEEQKPLTHLLLNTPLYKKQYEAHIRTIITESLDLAAIEAGVNSIQSLANAAATADDNKLFSMAQYEQNVEEAIWFNWGFGGILSTVEARKEHLLSLPEISVTSPSISSVEISDEFFDATGSYNEISAQVSGATQVTLMATTSEYNSHFEPYPMTETSAGYFSANLPFFTGDPVDWKFYIRAETEDAITLSPARAEYEFYRYSTTSGVSEQGLASTDLVSFIPNPTSSIFTVRGLANIKAIVIYDIHGRKIYSQNGNSSISVKSWNAGIYLVEVHTENGSVVSERLVVRQ